ncbi:MAG TPA: hypothetical protein VEH29_04470, partial [Acidimicrobiales bacterium]|nr:hypothetical protein [Acidimicrobiales bacterium]
ARRRPGTHNSRRRFVEQLVIRRLAGQYLRLLDVHARRSGHDPGSTASLRDVPGAGTPVGDAVTGEDPRESSPAERRFSAGGGPRQVGPVRPLQPVRPSLPVDARAGSFEGNGGGGDDSPDGRGPSFDIADFARGVRAVPQFSEMLDRMWPRLSAEELLHDLFGAKPLIALAGEGLLDAGEQAALYRERSSAFADIPWSEADLALIDEARVLLGPRRTRPVEGVEHEEEPRTYGHIVLDEAQDLSPMQLRMISRRSLSGSITAVGDIAQATGPWAPGSWEDVTAYLPDNRPARTAELSVSYRTPAEVVEVARHVLEEAVPGLAPPTAVRRTGIPPNFEALAGPDELLPAVVSTAAALVEEVSPGTTAVLVPASMVGELAAALDSEGMADCDPASAGLTAPLSLLPVDLANGLEFDAVVVVEPAAIVEESPQGLRSLYMALTRPTRRLSVVHFRPLPVVMTS